MAGSFQNKAHSIAKSQGIPLAHAQAILAYGARHASAKAKRANPSLLKVSGVKKPK